METPSAKLLPLMTVAADLRAAGATWIRVGEKVKRSAETCRQWPQRYPATWGRLFREAEGEFIAEGGAEARNVLRKALRDKNPRIAIAAAGALLRSRDAQRARETRSDRPDAEHVATEITEFARYLKGLTDAQLAAQVEQFLIRRRTTGGAEGTEGD